MDVYFKSNSKVITKNFLSFNNKGAYSNIYARQDEFLFIYIVPLYRDW